MNKKVILGVVLTFSFVFSGLSFSSAHAIDDSIGNETVNQPMEINEAELDNGTSGEPEVVCADPNEPGCEDKNSNPDIVDENGDEEELEPETWPLIVSLSTLGATIVFVIIINLFGRQK